MRLQVISVNVGRPREVQWHARSVLTSIWKRAVPGAVRVKALNLEGDQQSDLSVHGGALKAVYAYPSEHYDYWRRELPGTELPWGAFGENLTIEGLLEADLNIGDRLRVGSAEFQVTQPRMPCFKLGIRFGDDRMVKRFHSSGRSGFYFSVLREGEVESGNQIEVVERDARGVSVADIVALHGGHADDDQDLLRRAIDVPALPEHWKESFRQRLADLSPT